jgi:hypothetical protein
MCFQLLERVTRTDKSTHALIHEDDINEMNIHNYSAKDKMMILVFRMFKSISRMRVFRLSLTYIHT